MIQSPDTLALEYNVKPWSERHWELIGKSLRLMGQAGNKTLYIPLICRTNSGNEQSMVRWVKKGEDWFDYDFTVFERYLDLALRVMGRPKLVIFHAWDVYLKPPELERVVVKEEDSEYTKMEKEKAAARWALREKGPAVTLVAEGNTETTIYLPKYTDPRARELWEPVWKGLRKRMAERGLEETMALGILSDIRPDPAEAKFLVDISGGLPWVSHAHGSVGTREGRPFPLGKVVYDCNVWDFRWVADPARNRQYGWKEPIPVAVYHRFAFFNRTTMTVLRNLMEQNITGSQRGIGRLGADTWPVFLDKNGRRISGVTERYAESYWHSLNIRAWVLAPSPDGPVATARYEQFREGVQECEARIAIEEALTDHTARNRLDSDLVEKAQELLDERQRAVWKGLGIYDEIMAKGDDAISGMRG